MKGKVKIMNLQLCVPYEKCPFHCPMCIAADGKKFNNLHESDRDLYFSRLAKALDKTDGNVVLTGDTEPTLNKKWLIDVIKFIKSYKGHKIEIQTHNYNLADGFEMLDLIDVVAYSITSPTELMKVNNLHRFSGINRLVILGTKPNARKLQGFELPDGFQQVTIKLLQYGESDKANSIVDLIRATENMFEGIKFADGISVRIDTNCQESEKRYKVFRENGIRYKGW